MEKYFVKLQCIFQIIIFRMTDTRSLSYQSIRRQQDLETLTSIIVSWNSSRLDLFELTLPNENLEFSGELLIDKNILFWVKNEIYFAGVMRFYYQHLDGTCDQKVSTKCVRVHSSDTTAQVVERLVEKFRCS